MRLVNSTFLSSFLLQGPVKVILCHLEVQYEFQHPKDQLTHFAVKTFLSAMYNLSSLIEMAMA
jgi:hypothetical protein